MWYNTRMAKAHSSYPRFKHDRIENHAVLGKVKVYTFKTRPISNDDGAQSDFYTNNATPNNSRQFGIKIFNTSIEAFAAYQRQSLAAEQGLAPPVGKMVRWIIKANGNHNTVNRWGYETCLAVTTPTAHIEATIRGCPRLEYEYSNFVRDKSLMMWNPMSMETFLRHKECENEEQGFSHSDPKYFSAFSAISLTTHSGSLRMRLMEICLVGTQYDNISKIQDDGELWRDNPRLRLGVKVVENDDYCMSNDMHRGNLGLWKGNPVVIDFGYHIAIPEYRDFDRIETANWVAGAAA